MKNFLFYSILSIIMLSSCVHQDERLAFVPTITVLAKEYRLSIDYAVPEQNLPAVYEQVRRLMEASHNGLAARDYERIDEFYIMVTNDVRKDLSIRIAGLHVWDNSVKKYIFIPPWKMNKTEYSIFHKLLDEYNDYIRPDVKDNSTPRPQARGL